MDIIAEIRHNVKNRTYDFVRYQRFNYNPNTMICVVMTTHDRQKQTIFTLNSFKRSAQVSNLSVILIDDSDQCFFRREDLEPLNLSILYITIDPHRKTWINPCVNYNLGLQEVTSDIVILQNAEVCHCGDVIQYVHDHSTDQNYLVFDVGTTKSPDENVRLSSVVPPTFDQFYRYLRQIQTKWYQHALPVVDQSTAWMTRNLHFLTAIRHEHLRRLDGFDLDFALGTCYDDDELLLRIRRVLKLQIEMVSCEYQQVMGIHQWHTHGINSYDPQKTEYNRLLYEKKVEHMYT
jgi:hypothetical protein